MINIRQYILSGSDNTSGNKGLILIPLKRPCKAANPGYHLFNCFRQV